MKLVKLRNEYGFEIDRCEVADYIRCLSQKEIKLALIYEIRLNTIGQGNLL